jgi:transposase
MPRTRRGEGSILFSEHDREDSCRFRWVGRVFRAKFHFGVKVDPMQARSSGTVAARLAAQQLELIAMTQTNGRSPLAALPLNSANRNALCPRFRADGTKVISHTIKAGDHARLVDWLVRQRIRIESCLGRSVRLVVCYEAGYDGFWLVRLLLGNGIETVVFDPASFLKPRRGRWAKTDRLDAEGMTRTLRSWLAGDHSVAREVRVPSIEQEDAKRLCRERKNLVNERTRLMGRIKGLCPLHGIMVPGKRIGPRWIEHIDEQHTAHGRPLLPFLRREIGRLFRPVFNDRGTDQRG